jgi:hypothetical protein
MKMRLILGALLALALVLPQAAEAKTKKRSGSSSSSSSGNLAVIGDGPMGSFVAAPDHQVFANVLGFVYGLPTIGYEQALGDENSFTAQLGFRSQGAANFNVSYLGLMGSYRWWVGDHAKMQGIYVGPLGTIQTVNVSYDATTINTTTFAVTTTKKSATSMILGVGAEGGYQWILPAHFTFGVGLNLGYYFGSLDLGSGSPSIPFGGFGAGLDGRVGYAF